MGIVQEEILGFREEDFDRRVDGRCDCDHLGRSSINQYVGRDGKERGGATYNITAHNLLAPEHPEYIVEE